MGVSLEAALVGVHQHLVAADLPHAFGGAIALGYCIPEPRATKEIDVNVFVGVGRSDDVLSALAEDVEQSERNRAQLLRDGQTRLRWDDVPVDIFLSNHWFHGIAETRARRVPFADVPDLPVLACADLAVFKTFFARPKDELDVATMAQTGTIHLDELRSTVGRSLGDDTRLAFFSRVEEIMARL